MQDFVGECYLFKILTLKKYINLKRTTNDDQNLSEMFRSTYFFNNNILHCGWIFFF